MSIGSYSNNGYKLDVNGTARIQTGLTVTGAAVFKGAPNYGKYAAISSDASNSYLSFVGDIGGIISSSSKIQFYTQDAETNFCTANGGAYLKVNRSHVGGPYYATRLENTGGLGFQFVNVNNDVNIPGFHFDLPNGGSNNSTAFYITRSGTNLLNILPSGNVGLGNITPSSTLDVNGATGHSQFRLRTSYTPTSTSDTNGNTGDFSWDDNYFYIKTSAGWKRSALSTF